MIIWSYCSPVGLYFAFNYIYIYISTVLCGSLQKQFMELIRDICDGTVVHLKQQHIPSSKRMYTLMQPYYPTIL